MTASPSPGNQNLLLIAVIGIGAYWLMTHRAMAQPVAAMPYAQNSASNANKNQLIATGGNLLGGLLKNILGSGSSAAGGAMPSTLLPAGSSAFDMFAANPVLDTSPVQLYTPPGDLDISGITSLFQ